MDAESPLSGVLVDGGDDAPLGEDEEGAEGAGIDGQEWDDRTELILVEESPHSFDIAHVVVDGGPRVEIVMVAWVDPSDPDSDLWALVPGAAYPAKVGDRRLPPSLGLSRAKTVVVLAADPLTRREEASSGRMHARIVSFPQAALRFVTRAPTDPGVDQRAVYFLRDL